MKYKQPFDKPSDPDASYVNANPQLGFRGSILDIIAVEQVQREILKVITEAGITPSDNDLTQLWQAIRQIAGSIAQTTLNNILDDLSVTVGLPAAIAGGSANVLTGTYAPAPASYYFGLVLVTKITATNTGPAQINANGLGLKDIKRLGGAPLEANDQTIGSVVLHIYDGVAFQLVTLQQASSGGGGGGGGGLPFGYVSGFKIAYVSSTRVSISPGSARSLNNTQNLNTSTSFEKRTDVTWVIGDGNGGLDTGARAQGWYKVFVMRRTVDGICDVIFTRETNSEPSYPGGWGNGQLVRKFYIAADLSILPFDARDNAIYFRIPVGDIDRGTVGQAGTLFTMTVPPNAEGMFVFALHSPIGGSNPANIYISSGFQTSVAVPFWTSAAGSSLPLGQLHHPVDPAHAAPGLELPPPASIDKRLHVDGNSQIRMRGVANDLEIWTVDANTHGFVFNPMTA